MRCQRAYQEASLFVGGEGACCSCGMIPFGLIIIGCVGQGQTRAWAAAAARRGNVWLDGKLG